MNLITKNTKKVGTLFLMIMLAIPIVFLNNFSFNANAEGKTGNDMANWALNAYYEGWTYSYGSAVPGAVDCSGLIASFGVGGNRVDMMSSSPNTGDISSLPDVPGLGVYMPGHVGVYVGEGMVVDARTYGADMCCQPVSSLPWTNWFEIYGIDYGESINPYVTPTASSPFNLASITGIDKLFANIGCQTGILNDGCNQMNLNTILILCITSLILIGAVSVLLIKYRYLLKCKLNMVFMKSFNK